MRKIVNVLDKGFVVLMITDIVNILAIDSESRAPMLIASIITGILVAYLLIRIPYQMRIERRERRRSERELKNTLKRSGR